MEWYWWLLIIVFIISIPVKVKFMKWYGEKQREKRIRSGDEE